MFISQRARVFRKHLQKQIQKGAPYYGASRRATNLFPAPASARDVLLKDVSINGYSNLFLSLEANQASGCIIIQSERNKSRCGILVFRGRVLGCLYGQKDLDHYLFENDAYAHALKELQSVSKSVDVYKLKDEIVLAAASLFHGPTFERPEMQVTDFFNEVMAQLGQSNIPGCIVITDQSDLTNCMIYVYNGKIVGVYSSKQGWLNPDISTVYKFLNNKPQNKRIQACLLPCHNLDEVKRYSFSLSGLADRNFDQANKNQSYENLNIFYMLPMEEKRLSATKHKGTRLDRFLPRVSRAEHTFGADLPFASGTFTLRP